MTIEEWARTLPTARSWEERNRMLVEMSDEDWLGDAGRDYVREKVIVRFTDGHYPPMDAGGWAGYFRDWASMG